MKSLQAVLPIAGLGTRFLPWTKVVPKELLPIGNQPIAALLVDECLSVGITDICFVISPGKESIVEYFSSSPTLERELQRRGKLHLLSQLQRYDNVKLRAVYQHEQLGDGHALLQAADLIGSNTTVAVLFGDDLIYGEQNGLQQLVAASSGLPKNEEHCMLCLQDVPLSRVSQYGIVKIDDRWEQNAVSRTRKILDLVEKPSSQKAPSTLGIVGKYLLPSSIFWYLESIERGAHDGEVRIIDALLAARKTIDIYGHILEGIRLDTGTPEGYLEAIRFVDTMGAVQSESKVTSKPELALA